MASIIKFRKWTGQVGGVSTDIWVPSSAVPDSIGGGGGATVQQMYVSQDNGPTLLCTVVPPGDKTLSSAGLNGSSGSGYTQGQILPVAGGTPDPSVGVNIASIKITSVDGSGKPTGVAVNNAGAYLIAPPSPQTINSGAGSGCSFLLPFNSPIPVVVSKPPELSTTFASFYYKGVTYTCAYSASAATDAGHPAGNPGFVYYSITITGDDGTNLTGQITPPYLFGTVLKVGTLSDGSLYDTNQASRSWGF